jgi:hypothetical protein
METKICSICDNEKVIGEFPKRGCWCKECYSKYNKEYRNKNKMEIQEYQEIYRKENLENTKEYNGRYILGHKKEKSEYDKIYRLNHKEEKRIKDKEYRKKHKERLRKQGEKYRKVHKKEINKWAEERKKTNLNFKLAHNLRSRLNKAIRNKQKAGSAIFDLGCSIEYLIDYFKSMFYINPITGEIMSWENYGKWHVDHIKPLISFDLTDRKQFLEACNFINLQPLWAEDNLHKSDKLSENNKGLEETKTKDLMSEEEVI